MRAFSRRGFFAVAAGAVAAACSGPETQRARRSEGLEEAVVVPGLAKTDTPTPIAPTATPTPTPAPRGTTTVPLLAGTRWETPLVVHQSGLRGPAVMVLGGVHGNEPGGWGAADVLQKWEPLAGSLLVVPRANVEAIAGFVRTTEAIGDLNRLYPGDAGSALAMERMAAEIVEAARRYRVDLLLDMHESWAFYAEYPGTGTGALGQTITTGQGPRWPDFGLRLAERVNPLMSEREQMIHRDGTRFGRPTATPTPGQTNRGRSSLSVGGHLPGLTPVLVEMGQEHQSLERRIELHLIVARAALDLVGVPVA